MIGIMEHSLSVLSRHFHMSPSIAPWASKVHPSLPVLGFIRNLFYLQKRYISIRTNLFGNAGKMLVRIFFNKIFYYIKGYSILIKDILDERAITGGAHALYHSIGRMVRYKSFHYSSWVGGTRDYYSIISEKLIANGLGSFLLLEGRVFFAQVVHSSRSSISQTFFLALLLVDLACLV